MSSWSILFDFMGQFIFGNFPPQRIISDNSMINCNIEPEADTFLRPNNNIYFTQKGTKWTISESFKWCQVWHQQARLLFVWYFLRTSDWLHWAHIEHLAREKYDFFVWIWYKLGDFGSFRHRRLNIYRSNNYEYEFSMKNYEQCVINKHFGSMEDWRIQWTLYHHLYI